MYYIIQIRDSKYRKIAGPFSTKEEAESNFEVTRKAVIENDPWSHFDSFGVSKFN